MIHVTAFGSGRLERLVILSLFLIVNAASIKTIDLFQCVKLHFDGFFFVFPPRLVDQYWTVFDISERTTMSHILMYAYIGHLISIT